MTAGVVLLLRWRFFSDDAENVVSGLCRPDVAESVIVVGGEKENRSRAAVLCDAVDEGFDRSVFYDDELLVGVAVRGMRRLTGIECGDMALEVFGRVKLYRGFESPPLRLTTQSLFGLCFVKRAKRQYLLSRFNIVAG
jgi:hypothetical protein